MDKKSRGMYGTLFMNGRSQAVRLPKEYRLPGRKVKVSKEGEGILLTPVVEDLDAWFAELDRYGSDFMAGGRDQPPMPEPRDL